MCGTSAKKNKPVETQYAASLQKNKKSKLSRQGLKKSLFQKAIFQSYEQQTIRMTGKREIS